jgi:hypothetical protein
MPSLNLVGDARVIGFRKTDKQKKERIQRCTGKRKHREAQRGVA